MMAKMMVLVVLMMIHSAVGALIDDCKADPTNVECANSADFYNDSAVAADVQNLCNAMSWMPSCTIRELCEDGALPESSVHCGNWNLLSGVCSTKYGEVMQGMGGCTTYKMICAEGSVVDSCSDAAKQGPVELITTAEAKTAALAYCAANPDTEIMIEHHDEADHDHMHRRHLHKVCEECTEMRCTLAVTIVLHGCMADITQSFCTELKATCDANQNLGEFCAFSEPGSSKPDSSAAPRSSSVMLVLSFMSSLMPAIWLWPQASSP